MNSLTLFLGFCAFLLFGYVTYGRWLYKTSFNANNAKQMNKKQLAQTTLETIGSSSILFMIPAISLCLFWGWVPALLWLVVAHIICNLTYKLSFHQIASNASDKISFPNNLLPNCSNTLQPFFIKALQFSLIFLIAICINFAIEISTKNAGIFFAILILLPAYSLINQARTQQDKVIGSLVGIICFGLAIFLPTQLGIFIHGNWQPLGELAPWLALNDKSILALLFVAAVTFINKAPQHHDQIARLTGAIICCLFALLLCSMLFLRPALDAPINTAGTNNPWFMQVFLLLLFPAMIMVFQIVLNARNNSVSNSHVAGQQSASLFDILFAALLVSIMAASIGLGAWSTHYTNWSNDSSLLHHFSLSSTSITETLSTLSLPNNISQSFISLTFALLIISISSRLLSFTNQLLPEKETSPITNLLPDNEATSHQETSSNSHPLISSLLYILTLGLLWQEFTLSIWLLFGVINWALLMPFLFDLNISLLKKNQRQHPLLFATALIFAIGLLQSIAQTALWYANQQWFYAIFSTIILASCYPFFSHYIKTLLPELKKTEDINIFD